MPDDPPLLAVPEAAGSFVVDGGAVVAVDAGALALVVAGSAVVVVDADPSPVLLDVTP